MTLERSDEPDDGMDEQVLAALDQAEAVVPPAALRRRVLDAAAARRPERIAPSSVPTLFASQVAALARLVAELDEDDWRRPAPPYEWTVHGLLAHLLIIETYTAVRLGLATEGPEEAHHLAMGAEQLAAELRSAPPDTARRWLERATATADALRHPDELPTTVTLHGWPFGLDGAMIARAFELWTHAEDIRRATGRPEVAADPADLATMSAFSVGALPLTLPLTDPTRVLTPTRIVLTGAGGGTFDLVELTVSAEDSETIPATAAGGVSTTGHGTERFDTLIVADVTDYCRVVARRIPPGQLDCHIEGDAALAQALLHSAGVFAV